MWSGNQPVHITGEQYCLTDVRQSEHRHNQPIGSESPPGMRRHAKPERAQVKLKTLRIQTFLFNLLYEKIVLVHALRPAR